MMNHTRTHLARLSALSVLIASGLAIAAPPAPPVRPTPPTSPDAPLRGPSVEDRAVPGVTPTFGEMEDKRMRAARVPMRVFLAAIRSLDAQDTPESLRLTPAQQEELASIETELRTAMRTMARDRKQNAQRPEPGERMRNRGPRPDADDGGDAPAQNERRRERVRRGDRAGAPAPEGMDDMRIMEGQRRERLERAMNAEASPEIEAVRVRAWAMLDEAQQDLVRAEIDIKMEEIRAEREARRGEGKPELSDENAPARERGRAVRQRLNQMSPEEILQRIDQLPPERRERALERFRRYLEEQEAADKPAPDMDEVEVPAP